MWSVKCEVWSVKFELWSAKSAVCSVRCGVSREGHGRDRLSLNYRSIYVWKLPPPACPGLCYLYNIDMYIYLFIYIPTYPKGTIKFEGPGNYIFWSFVVINQRWLVNSPSLLVQSTLFVG